MNLLPIDRLAGLRSRDLLAAVVVILVTTVLAPFALALSQVGEADYRRAPFESDLAATTPERPAAVVVGPVALGTDAPWPTTHAIMDRLERLGWLGAAWHQIPVDAAALDKRPEEGRPWLKATR